VVCLQVGFAYSISHLIGKDASCSVAFRLF
jgi:hypothetical protein